MADGGVGVFGGTFDPIHNGHLAAASEVAARFALSRVVFVPSGESWQKSDRVQASPEQRYEMTLLATATNPQFTVSRVDVDRPGPSYTIDTMTDLGEDFPEVSDWSFIVGADAAANLATWHRLDELQQRCRIIAVTRPNHQLVSPVPVHEVPIPALDISSSDIRDSVREGRQIRYLVPEPVRAFIVKSALYRNPDGGSDER